MGLDMYLRASRYVSGWDFHTDDEYSPLVDLFGMRDAVTPNSPSADVRFTVAYWRKANAIHNWFVKNVQDGKDECQSSYVSREQLTALRDLCQKVIDDTRMEPGMLHAGTSWDQTGRHEMYEAGMLVTNTEVAEQLLPTTSGFFFGGTEYNEWYISDLKRTIEQIDNALKLSDDWTFYYEASW